MVPLSVVVCSALLAFAAAIEVQQCPGLRIDDLKNKVQIKDCKSVPCEFSKGKKIDIAIKFKTSDKNIQRRGLKKHVTIEMFKVVMRPTGVGGDLVMLNKLRTATGTKVSSWPLTARTNYVYNDSFTFPGNTAADVKLHYALQANGKDVFCFEMPAKIK